MGVGATARGAHLCRAGRRRQLAVELSHHRFSPRWRRPDPGDAPGIGRCGSDDRGGRLNQRQGQATSTKSAFRANCERTEAMGKHRVVITGTGAVCAAGRDPQTILGAVRAGRSVIGPIRQWDASTWPMRVAGEIPDFNPRELVEDRKLHKLIRRTDLFGLYAASKAIEAAGIVAHRDSLDAVAAAQYSDRTGVY